MVRPLGTEAALLLALLCGSLAGGQTPERDRPPPPRVPFLDTPADQLANYTVILGTELGDIEIGFFPEDAPEHVRQFLRFSELGLYTRTRFHRVIPGFVIQGGSLGTRKEPVSREHARYVKLLQPEFNKRKHVRGIVSMARGEDPGSGVDSFFIVLASIPALDGNYTVFGQVVQGIETVDGISQIPTRGETPILPIIIQDVRLRVRDSKERGSVDLYSRYHRPDDGATLIRGTP